MQPEVKRDLPDPDVLATNSSAANIQVIRSGNRCWEFLGDALPAAFLGKTRAQSAAPYIHSCKPSRDSITAIAAT